MSDEEKKSFFDKIDNAWNGKGEKKEVNEYDNDEWRNTRIQSKNIFRMLKQKYNNDINGMKDGLKLVLKQNNTKDDQAAVMWDEFNKFFKIKEVKESTITEKMGSLSDQIYDAIGNIHGFKQLGADQQGELVMKIEKLFKGYGIRA